MSINWVMRDETAKRPFVPLPHERAIHASPQRTALSLRSPKPSATTSPDETIVYSSSSGTAYITSQRLVYLPSTPTATLQSFSVPLLKLHDTYVTAPWFGPNVVVGQVQPIPEGGLPTPSTSPYMLELKLTFNEGGAYDFHGKFAEIRERLVQNREMVREIGENAAHQELHGEQLPAYEENDSHDVVPAAAQGATDPSVSQAHSTGHLARQPPSASADEPPPGYEETQHST